MTHPEPRTGHAPSSRPSPSGPKRPTRGGPTKTQAPAPERPAITAEHAAHDEAIARVWRDYKDPGFAGDKRHLFEQLLIEYVPLVKGIAGRMASSMPSHISTEDLNAYGMGGLMSAIENFEPERGWKFTTFGTRRIKGAILDELRANDWVPRAVREKIKSIESTITDLQEELGRTPTDTEVADSLGVTVKELREMRGHATTANVVALDDLMHNSGDGGGTLGDRLTDSRIAVPGDDVEAEETRRAVRTAITELPTRQRVLFTLYYYEQFTLAQIGEVLGVSESAVHQMRKTAQSKLAATLARAS